MFGERIRRTAVRASRLGSGTIGSRITIAVVFFLTAGLLGAFAVLGNAQALDQMLLFLALGCWALQSAGYEHRLQGTRPDRGH